MSPVRLTFYTVLAMVAFAGNSLLCRLALSASTIDAASFTAIRILSGATVLAILVLPRGRGTGLSGNWGSAIFLLLYTSGFSFAYVSLPAATGALLLFGAVQTTMIGYGLCTGERANPRQVMGIFLALAGVFVLFLPGLQAPPPGAGLLMIGAGISWGIYSLRGGAEGEAARATAGGYIRGHKGSE